MSTPEGVRHNSAYVEGKRDYTTICYMLLPRIEFMSAMLCACICNQYGDSFPLFSFFRFENKKKRSNTSQVSVRVPEERFAA